MVNLLPGQKVMTIEVTNRGGVPAAIQIRAYGWSQIDDEDMLSPTRDIVLSPPIFTVPEGVSQTVRLLLRGERTADREGTYRLLIDEVPPTNNRDQQVAIAMRVSLPVIVASTALVSHKLQWRAARLPGGQILLSASNLGQTYDKIQDMVVTLPDGTQPKAVARGNNPYILAGAQRHWLVQDTATPTGSLHLSTTTRAGKGEHSLALDR